MEAERLVIIGAGFIGLEVAASARSLGVPVTVVEAAARPLEHALGEAVSDHVAGVHARNGVEILCETTVTRVEGPDHVEAVTLSDGRRLDADVVLAAIGAIPAVEWLEGSGLNIDNGVICDKACAVTGAPGVVAAGDISNWHNPLYERRMRIEHWTNAIEQGTFAARRLLGLPTGEGFVSAPYFWSEQFDMRIQSIGTTVGHDEARLLDRGQDSLLVAYGTAGRLTGVAGVNVGAAVMRWRSSVLERASMNSLG
jgi:NADPH-dependent 2,4-dienoyl-CoA reductase/sulfur reductase-like enzyme